MINKRVYKFIVILILLLMVAVPLLRIFIR